MPVDANSCYNQGMKRTDTTPVISLAEAAALLERGERTIALGGNALHRVPHAFVCELAKRTDLQLHIVKTAGAWDIDLLCLSGIVRAVSAGFVGYETEFGLARHYRRAVEQGHVAAHEHACYTVIAALRAAAYGVPFLPVNAMQQSDLPAARGFTSIRNPYGGEASYIAVPAIVPDLAVLHVQYADRAGNGVIIGPKAEDLLIARAARRVVLTTERIVETEQLPVPRDHVDIPGVLVDAVVLAPGGAAPGSCAGEYPVDPDGVRALLNLESREALLQMLDAQTGKKTGRAPVRAGGSAQAGARSTQDQSQLPPSEIADAADTMAVAMARLLRGSASAFHGLASPLPAVAVALAKRLFNPALRYLNIAGGVNSGPETPAVSTCAPAFLEGSESFFSLTDIFDLSARGMLDTAFLGGVQIDRSGAINNSVIGPFHHPKVKLPGGAGSAAIVPTAAHIIVWRTRHDARSIVERCDFVTTRGNVREVVTPLGILAIEDGELRVACAFPHSSLEEIVASTGFPIQPARAFKPFDPLTDAERAALAEVDPHGIRYSEFR